MTSARIELPHQESPKGSGRLGVLSVCCLLFFVVGYVYTDIQGKIEQGLCFN